VQLLEIIENKEKIKVKYVFIPSSQTKGTIKTQNTTALKWGKTFKYH